MRTSVTGPSSSRPTRPFALAATPARSRAFTLIEVLVVVVIVGIISSVVLLSTSLIDDDRGVRQDAQRMVSLMELAADEALLQGRDFGIEFVQDGYRFVEYDPYLEQWFEIAGDELLRPRALGEDLRIELFIEDRRVLLAAEYARIGGERRDEDNRREADYAPHALLLSSGDVSPFSVAILRDDRPTGLAVEVTPAGGIEIDDGSDDEFRR